MRTKSLLECIDIPNQQTNIHFNKNYNDINDIDGGSADQGTSISIVNQTIHCLFKDRISKHSFYEKQQFNNGTVNDFEVYGIACGSSIGLESYMTILQSNLTEFDQLLEYLNLILNGSREIEIAQVINLLIIDNISIYYWKLKSGNTNTTHVYATFYDLLNQIKSKYKCNVLITSFDVRFDKGFNCNWTKSIEVSKLNSLSYLPATYLTKFDFIIHVDTTVNKPTNDSTSTTATTTYRYFNKVSNNWINLQ
ncbi:hypothetical protein DFJ63DRAFT_313472 [Scheffersomyces coipomensis]|uniref:uncharacterized protein n=1 Tax=Scheffersomyces coipomensis TaxID=1788519 RepID=UPI00315CA14B